MIWQQRMDELRSYIEHLEKTLAEVDALVFRSIPVSGDVSALAIKRHIEREDAKKPF